MAARKTRTQGIRAKVWGNETIMEFDGGLAEGIRYAFMYLPESARGALLRLLADDHAQLSAQAAPAAAIPAGDES